MDALFCGTDLAARIERDACAMLERCVRAVKERRPGADLFCELIGGGVAAYVGENSPLNKLAGLGFAGPLDVAALEAVERRFSDAGAPVQAEVSTLADPAVYGLLCERGYILRNFEVVLGRRVTPADAAPACVEPPPGIGIAPVDADGFETWLDVIVDGFAAADEQGVASHESFPKELLRSVIRDMGGAPGFAEYLATRGGEVAGGGSMWIGDGGFVHLCGAATLPAHRRKGVQTALLRRRLADARENGCELAVIVTQPGSKSMENAVGQGFVALYVRAVLVRGV